MQIFRFRLLRYLPDPIQAKEVVNIGLIASFGGKLYGRQLSKWEKVWAIDPEADIGLIKSSIGIILRIFMEKGNIQDEPIQTFEQKFRIGVMEEIRLEEGEDLSLTMESVYARLVEGKKEELPDIISSDIQEASSLVTSLALHQQFKEGNIDKARMEIEKLDKEDITVEHLAVLILCKDEKDWMTAWDEIYKRENLREPWLFTALAYRFWFVGKADMAAHIAEEGLNRVSPDNEEFIYKFKNSLAYYYAELAKPENKEDALRYSREAMEQRKDAQPIDTRGYVLISYGENPDEILEGVGLCEDARRKEGIASFPIYYKNISRAFNRLKELKAI